MPVGLTVFLKVSLVSTGGYHRFITSLDNSKDSAGAILKWALNCHVPCIAIWLTAYALDISPKIYKAACYTFFCEVLIQHSRSIALSYTSKVNLSALWDCAGTAKLYLVIVHIFKKLSNLAICWNPVLTGSKAPGFQNRIYRYIQCPACAVANT